MKQRERLEAARARQEVWIGQPPESLTTHELSSRPSRFGDGRTVCGRPVTRLWACFKAVPERVFCQSCKVVLRRRK